MKIKRCNRKYDWRTTKGAATQTAIYLRLLSNDIAQQANEVISRLRTMADKLERKRTAKK